MPILVGGEAAIITLSFLSQQGYISLANVIIYGFIGAILADLIWYVVTKSKLIQKLKSWKKIKHHYENVEKKIESASHRKDFFILLTAKFVVGTRVVTILYLTLRKIRLSKFLLFSAITNAIWLGSMITIGVLAGRGFAILGIFDKIQYIITGVVLVLIAWHFIEKFITKRVVGADLPAYSESK